MAEITSRPALHTTVIRGRVVTPDQVLDDALVVVEGQHITWVGPVSGAPAGVEVPAPDTHPLA